MMLATNSSTPKTASVRRVSGRAGTDSSAASRSVDTSSAPLSIAAVTAVLRSLLENGLISARALSHLSSDIAVTTLPPDRVLLGADERPHLNIYMYAIGTAASVAGSMRSRIEAHRFPSGFGYAGGGASKPLNDVGSGNLDERDSLGQALDLELSYLVTAYGPQDLHAEVLLGHALHLLQSVASLDSETVQSVLRSATPRGSSGASYDGDSEATGVREAVSAADLAKQMQERGAAPLRVSVLFPPTEEMSRLWGMFQAPYRPSIVVRVSVVQIAAAETDPR